MIIGKKEKDRSGLIGRDLVCSVAVPQGQQSIFKKGGFYDTDRRYSSIGMLIRYICKIKFSLGNIYRQFCSFIISLKIKSAANS